MGCEYQRCPPLQTLVLRAPQHHNYVQGHRKLGLMDATFAFLSYLKLAAHGYAKTPFLV